MLGTRPLGLALFVALSTTDVAAHILPADFILRMLVEKRRRLDFQDLTVELTTEIEGHDSPVEERVYLKPPERMRRVRQGEDSVTVYVFREGEVGQGPENAIQRIKGAPADLLTTLLTPAGEDLEQAQARVLRVLAAHGINTRTVSLSRDGDGVAYVIGAPPKTPDKPQLWIDKDTFLPTRAIFTRKLDGKDVRVELRWLEFASSATGELYPRVIEMYHNGVLRERSEAQKVESNRKVPDSFFDLPL